MYDGYGTAFNNRETVRQTRNLVTLLLKTPETFCPHSHDATSSKAERVRCRTANAKGYFNGRNHHDPPVHYHHEEDIYKDNSSKIISIRNNVIAADDR